MVGTTIDAQGETGLAGPEGPSSLRSVGMTLREEREAWDVCGGDTRETGAAAPGGPSAASLCRDDRGERGERHETGLLVTQENPAPQRRALFRWKGAPVPLEVIIVQHAEKERTPGDPGLTALGREQARECSARLRTSGPIDELWSSPLRRAIQTAVHIASALGIPGSRIRRDARIRERVNWPGEPHQTREAFQRDWEHSTADRDFQPLFGDSSRAAGDRFAAFLEERHAARSDGRIVVVAHGGVTVDLVRSWCR